MLDKLNFKQYNLVAIRELDETPAERMPVFKNYGFDRLPDADNAAVGKYSTCIAAG